MERTIAEFRNGDREAPKAKKEKMDELTDDDAKALLHFYASQQ
jgi:cytochrome c553